MNNKFFSIPLDTTISEDIASLDKALDEKLSALTKNKEATSEKEPHSA